jgi:hypothetical protein
MEWAPQESRRGVAKIELGRAKRFVFMGRINENHSCYFVGEKAGILSQKQTPKREPCEQIRRGHACFLQQLVKVPSDCRASSRVGAWIAPAHASPVIPARFCELRNFRLYRLPLQADAACRLQNHCRPACPRAENVEGPASDVYRPSDLWNSLSILSASELFVNNAGYERGDNEE